MSAVDEYLAKISKPQRAELERIRQIVKITASGAEEVMSYGIPGFKYKGKYLVGYAAFKNHLSLFPTAEPVEVLKSKLDGFDLSKGTIQFTLDRTIPKDLIKELVLVRIRAIES